MIRPLWMLSNAVLALSAGSAFAREPEPQPQDGVTLSPITVVATRTETRADEVPATVTVFTDEEIERLLVTDIKDLIRYEPGISVPTQPARFGAALGTAGRDGNSGFTIRGLGGDRVLIVTDGVRNADGFTFGAQNVGRGGYNDLDLIKSVEILRGPASALYGSDGVAGAVSFTTKDPEDFLVGDRAFGARGRVGYNSADESWTEGLAVAGRTGAVSGLLAYTRRDAQETETQGDVTGDELTTATIGTPNTPTFYRGPGFNYGLRTLPNPLDFQSDALLAKLLWDVAPGHSLRLTYESYRSGVDYQVLSGRTTRPQGTVPALAATAVLGLTAADATERERIGLDWRFEDSLGLDDARVSAYAQDSTTRQYTFEDRVGVDRIRDNTFDNAVYGFAADASRTLTLAGVEHQLTFGGDWSRTTQQGIRDGTVPPFGETFPTSPFPETDYTLAGVFIQDEIGLLDGRLRIIPALRWDAYELSTDDDPLYTGARADQDDGRVSPKLGVVWQVTPSFQLFGSWGAGFKAPTPSQVNNGFSNIASGYVSVPNPDLDPETSRSVEVGLRLRNQDFVFGTMGFQAVAFRADYEDFISQQQVGGAFTPANPAVFQFVNFSEVEVEGLEGRARIDWDNGFSFNAAAAWADGTQTTAGRTTPLSTIDPIKLVGGLAWNDPSGRFGLEGVVTWSDAKDAVDTVGLSCRATGAVAPANGCYVGEASTLVDVTGYWNVTERVTARAGVFNLTDETYGWWSDVRGVSATSAVIDAYTQPGRNFGLSLSLRL